MKRFVIHVIIKAIKWNEYILRRARVKLLYELDATRKAEIEKDGYPTKT